MFNLTIVFLTVILVAAIITAAAHILPQRNVNAEKSSPYECGSDPLNSARIPFSFRFFLVAILFLLFDLEIALLFPLPTAIFVFNPITPTVLTLLFTVILLVGLIFEWINGGLDWAE
uniref:NADH-ubiquinone oxidoreductase chain 3 n=1 Tax=Astropecten polyacanthus TaxID=60560 RepID=Q5KSP9_ASTPO|nr:NADH dehydrogenase subunit 3 [Astropecten polyacanthus]BAD86704.1 NADH dehydrogenase subunit 3 [Astropecten polyacanthus]